MAAQDNHVHVLTMGGTIDKDYPKLKSGYAFEFGNEPAVVRILKSHPNLGISYDVTTICKKDSLDVDDDDRGELYDAICSVLEKRPYARFIVTHGTDTMLKSAKFIRHRMKENFRGVVAFTGATKPERFVDSDASFNVGCAVGLTSFSLPGSVLICLNGNVIPAEKCVRDEESGLFKWK